MANDKPVKQAQKETDDLRESVKGAMQDRVYKGLPIPPKAQKAFKLKKPGEGGYAEIDTIDAGNPLHYGTHIAQKGATKLRKKRVKTS